MSLDPLQAMATRAQAGSVDLCRSILDGMAGIAVIATGADGAVTVWNEGAACLFGHREGDVAGCGIDVLFTPEDRAAGVPAAGTHRALATGRAEGERWLLRRDGSRFWAAWLMAPCPGGGLVTVVRDRTAQRRAEDALRQSEDRLRTLVDGMPQLVWRSGQGGYWTWSGPQWLAFTGQDQADSLGHGWLDAVHPGDRAAMLQAWDGAAAHGTLDVEFRLRRARDRAYAWFRTRSAPVRTPGGRIVEWLGTSTEIEDHKEVQRCQAARLDELGRRVRGLEAEVAERRRAEARLRSIAFHDDLTGLRNRAFFMDRLRLALSRRDSEPGLRCAVLFLDLDRFKLVNDSLGHGAGNLVLVEAARRLQSCLCPGDTLARVGGDEFAVLSEGFDHLSEVEETAERIAAALRQPFQVGAAEVQLSCSVGVAEAQGCCAGADGLLRGADAAMYQAKRRDPGSYAVFAHDRHDGATVAVLPTVP